jgi:hypothetical protein
MTIPEICEELLRLRAELAKAKAEADYIKTMSKPG